MASEEFFPHPPQVLTPKHFGVVKPHGVGVELGLFENTQVGYAKVEVGD
jgi:hypothetical protein